MSKFQDYIESIDLEAIEKDAAHRRKEFDKQAKDRLKESSLNRVRKSWMEHDTGTITAYRDSADCGNGDGINKKVNKSRNMVLRSKLSKLNYGYIKIKGSYMEGGKETKETSFFVVDINDSGNLESDLIKLGFDFDQDSIAFAKSESDYHLISTNNCENNWVGKGKMGVKMNIGQPKFGKSGIEAFSRVNGRSFIFEGFEQITLNMLSISSLRNMNYICERYHDKKSILSIGLDVFDKQAKDRLKESSLNRVRKAWMEHDTGTITAYRNEEDCGDGRPISKKEKDSRNYDLRSILLSMGYGVTKVKDSWFENGGIEKGEASFFVVDYKDKGGLKKSLIKLGVRYEQDAIVYADTGSDYHLISTNSCPKAYPGSGRVGVEINIGQPKFGKSGINGFSRVNGRAFVFEGFHISKLTDYGLTEWRGHKAIYDKYINHG